MIWLGILIVLPLWYFSDFIILTLFGNAFTDAIGVFEITIFILLLIFIASVHGKWLLSEGLQRYSLFYSITGVIANIVANLYFIPKYGIVGAAYGTVLAQTVPYFLLFRNSKTRKQFYMIGIGFFPIRYFKVKKHDIFSK
jgi:O-antigen/teichoic acid export membrane protein